MFLRCTFVLSLIYGLADWQSIWSTDKCSDTYANGSIQFNDCQIYRTIEDTYILFSLTACACLDNCQEKLLNCGSWDSN